MPKPSAPNMVSVLISCSLKIAPLVEDPKQAARIQHLGILMQSQLESQLRVIEAELAAAIVNCSNGPSDKAIRVVYEVALEGSL